MITFVYRSTSYLVYAHTRSIAYSLCAIAYRILRMLKRQGQRFKFGSGTVQIRIFSPDLQQIRMQIFCQIWIQIRLLLPKLNLNPDWLEPIRMGIKRRKIVCRTKIGWQKIKKCQKFVCVFFLWLFTSAKFSFLHTF